MKKVVTFVLSLGLVVAFTFGNHLVVEAKTSVKTFSNCKDMNKVYKGGVARNAKVKNKGGKTKYKPFVSQGLYDANKKSDRDNDLIACEQ